MPLKKVEFEKIKLKNFLSYGNDPIEIEFQKGITFVTGYNKDEDDTNGVGKTSLIVDSLSFLIFGETYRDINQKLIKNNVTGGTCIVEGWLKVNDDSYHIIRSLSPNKLILGVNGEYDTHTKTVAETTKDIINAIGISKTVFTNTIVMTSKDSMAFLNQKKEFKTKFIEDILGLEVFSEFFKKSKDKLKSAVDIRDKVIYRISQLQKSLESEQLYFKREQEKNTQAITSIQNEIDARLKRQPIDNSETIKELTEIRETLSKETEERNQKVIVVEKKLYEIQLQLQQKQKELRIIEQKPLECPTCKRPFSDHSSNELDVEREKLKKEINVHNNTCNKLSTAIAKAKDGIRVNEKTIQDHKNKISLLDEQQKMYESARGEIALLTLQLNQQCSFVNPFTDKIKDTNDNLINEQSVLPEYEKEVRICSAIKDLASPTGVKALMVNKIIDSLNDRINYYLLKMASPFRVHFDEFFEESISHKSGNDYSYDSLSGGEAKRVDLAMLFAFRDIRRIQSNISVNLTVMDELFDSALSEKGMYSVLELLKDMGDECYYIVTHRKEAIDQTGCENIHLIKENGITRIDKQD